MTAQMGDFFEYQNEECYLLGYSGGVLPSAKDFGMNFYPSSTADARGHCMWYCIHNNKLAVKYVEIRGNEILPIHHQYTLIENERGAFYGLNYTIVPLTGFVLLSDVWDFAHLYLDSAEDEKARKYRLYEIEVNNGDIVRINEIGSRVRKKTLEESTPKLGLLWQGNTVAEQLASIERVWNQTEDVLGRKYDVLYIAFYYINFRENIEELKRKLNHTKDTS